MPDPKLQAYLASKYLSGPKADAILARTGGKSETRKKKKKQHKADSNIEQDSSSRGLHFREDGISLNKEADENDEDFSAQVVETEQHHKFRRTRWTSVDQTLSDGTETPASEEPTNFADEQPQFAGENGLNLNLESTENVKQELTAESQAEIESKKDAVTTTTRPKAGLRTREEMRAEREAKEAKEEEERKRENLTTRTAAEEEENRLAQQTVYRDTSGRRVDIAQEEEANRRRHLDEKRREKEKKEWNKGAVQREQATKARKQLEEEKHTAFARHADDKRMNDTLRAIDRADDPAAKFLRSRKPKGPQRPKYTGPLPPPNRFRILPGYRWDGVDRSNGFENAFFQRINERERQQRAAQAWGQEDM